MGTTYVYASTEVDVPVRVGLAALGPEDPGATLERADLPARSGSTLRVARIPRVLGDAMYELSLPFALVRPSGPEYLVSLQVLLRGHSFGSMIWWRWRTTTALIGDWATDHEPHWVVCGQGGSSYRFTVEGVGTFGYDDVNVTLRTA